MEEEGEILAPLYSGLHPFHQSLEQGSERLLDFYLDRQRWNLETRSNFILLLSHQGHLWEGVPALAQHPHYWRKGWQTEKMRTLKAHPGD